MGAGTARAASELHASMVWKPSADELPELSRPEMLRYLGYTGQQLGPDLAARIDEAAELAVADARPAGAFRTFGVDAAGVDANGAPCIHLAGSGIELRGRDIFRHLKDAVGCAVLCCTLGMGTERRMRVLSASDPLAATLYDAACSAYVEDAVDALEARIRSTGSARGLSTNWRFSCGYGDCPLDAQPSLLDALNAARLLGVTPTPSNLLVPCKSVTALIGLFDGPASDADTRPSCAICRQSNACPFRPRGLVCYG